ncbi:MAG: C1 family peptidase [Bacteroidota bacterium]
MELNAEFLVELQRKIAEKNLRWQPVQKSRGLTSELRRMGLGYIPSSEEPEAEEIEARAKDKQASQPRFQQRSRGLTDGLPTSWDWRNVKGKNYLDSVVDQQKCGSCVSFAMAAFLQANARISSGIAVNDAQELAMDLSEAHLHFCGSKTDCDGGWNLPEALEFAQKVGVTHESFFPYSDRTKQCDVQKGWREETTQIKDYHKITSTYNMKSWIASRGPLIARFNVYDDFFAYKGGVYEYVHGDFAGGHATCVLGFDDQRQAWLCKNSWGPDWGENGYYWLGYGQCGIDESMFAVESFQKISGMPVRPFLMWYQFPDFRGPHEMLYLADEDLGICHKLLKNNKMKSFKFFGNANWKLELYDSPSCRNRNDWAEIVYPDDYEVDVVEVPHLDDPSQAVPAASYILHEHNGMSGKVSGFKIIKNEEVAILDWWTRKHFRGRHFRRKLFPHEFGKVLALVKDNRMRSFKLDAPQGWRLALFDSPDGSKREDWAEVKVTETNQLIEVPLISTSGQKKAQPAAHFHYHKVEPRGGRISSIQFFGPSA